MKIRSKVRMTGLIGCFLAAMTCVSIRAQEFLPPPTLPPAEQLPPPATKKESLEAMLKSDPALAKELEAVIEGYIKKREGEKKKADEEKKRNDEANKKGEEQAKHAEQFAADHAYWQGHGAEKFNFPILYDSLHPYPDPTKKSTKWYDKMSIRGYTQIRFDKTVHNEDETVAPNLFGDRGINGNAEGFTVRRLRFIFSGDLSDYMSYYIQPDFASTISGVSNANSFTQMRDVYADVYFDKEKEHRLRIGLSKVPYGWENLQSSINRIPLDRTDAMNTAVAPNERDLGVIYYWTPVAKQKLLKALVDGGLKGSGNYGIFGLGIYDGQGGSVPEANMTLHTVARFTWPVQLDWSNGQVIEASIQGYRGNYVVSGSAISPLGIGPTRVPVGTGTTGAPTGQLEQRVAASFIVFPQPFGFQAEWQIGEGPGLDVTQTRVITRDITGGYLMGLYKHDTEACGIFTPYCRYQQYTGGYRNVANAPYGQQRQIDFGIEWQIRKEMEVVCEYSLVDTPNFTAINTANTRSYREFEGSVFRVQFQINY